MPATFVIGRAGAGKTHRIFQQIVSALKEDPLGPPIFWLLPRQSTFSAERDLTCASGLPGFCRVRIVSFDEFGRDIFEDCGGSCIPEVTPIGRQMIIGHLLRQFQRKLRFFSSVARQPGLASELDHTFEELERAGKGAADLRAMIDPMQPERGRQTDPFLDKIHDLHLLYERYTQYLGQDRLDQHRRTRQVLAALETCMLLPRAAVYVDGFFEFTDYERQFLVGVARAGARVEISLLIDPESPTVRDPHALPWELSVFHKTEDAYRRLSIAFASAGIAMTEPVLLRDRRRFDLPALAHLERFAFSEHRSPREESTGIELIQASDRRAEADAIARAVRAELARGVRLRDIAVIVRDLSAYHAPIEASFREHNIPLFLDRRRTAAHHPLLQTLRALFRIAGFDWPHDAVMNLMKSGLAGVNAFEADGAENYVLSHRLFGAAAWRSSAPWAYRRQITNDDDVSDAGADEAEKVRRHFADRLGPLLDKLRKDEPLSVREIAAEIFQTFDRLEVRQALANWMHEAELANHIEQRDEHERIWAELASLFQQMVDLLGDEWVTPADFVDILESGLERFDLALTPPTVDQVLLGQIDRTRSSQLKVVFIAGMNEGEFPAVPRDSSVLSDRERRELGRRQLELDPGLHRRQLDERLLGYFAMTRASERLYLSRAMSGADGKPLSPSPFWLRVMELFPQVHLRSLEIRDRMDAADIATPRQLVTSLIHWARSRREENDSTATSEDVAVWPVLYTWLAQRPCNDDDIDVARSRAWKSLSYTNSAKMSAEIRAQWFTSGGELSASPSELETFAGCHFRHFVQYGLHLRSRDDQDIGPQDLGRLYHQLLDRLIDGALRAGQTWSGVDSPIDAAAIRACAEDVSRALRHELMLGSARNRYLLQYVEKTLAQFITSQNELLKRGNFRPAFTGLTYGRGGRMKGLEIRTPCGATLRVHGKIDRVDIAQNSEACTVLDYKLGGNTLSMDDAYWGLSLQLLTALLAVRAGGRELSGKRLNPVAGFYLQLIRRIQDVAHPDDALPADDPARLLATKPRGIFDARYLSSLDKTFTEGKSEVLNAYLKKDGELGRLESTDSAQPAEFEAILAHTRTQLGELADGILAGKVDIEPYRLKRATPCPKCEFRSICRFENSINGYRHLQAMGRADVFVRLTQRAAQPKSENAT